MSGIIQATNLQVDNIKHSGGTTGLTIDSSGDVTESNFELDQWRLATAFSTDNATVTGWERVDDATFSKVGTGMTESSGIFTFPRTGLWVVRPELTIYIDGSDGTAGVICYVSSNSGSSYDGVGTVYEGADSATNQMGAISCVINVTNASTFRFKLTSSSLATNSNINADTNTTHTAILFERKAPPQS